VTAPNLTPAEALAMFKDWDDPDLTICDFCNKWYVSHDPDSFALIAIAALETLLSEHEATKAKLAAYEAKEPAAAVPSDEEVVVDSRSLRLHECSDGRIKKQLRWARENGRASAICTLVEMVLVRIGVKL
jgi:hypothetical protein